MIFCIVVSTNIRKSQATILMFCSTRLQRVNGVHSCLWRGTTPASYSTPLHMVQHVADWVAPLPRSQHFLPPPFKFFHTPLSFPLLCARELVAIIMITTKKYWRLGMMKLSIWRKFFLRNVSLSKNSLNFGINPKILQGTYYSEEAV